MIEETGTIVEADEHYAWVEAASSSSCSHCTANQACGTASLQKWFNRRPNRLRVVNDQNLNAGERVVIGIPEQALVKGSFLVYMLPLLCMIAGAMLGVFINDLMQWHFRDALSIIFALLTLIGGFVLVQKHYLRKSKQQSQFQPIILRRLL